MSHLDTLLLGVTLKSLGSLDKHYARCAGMPQPRLCQQKCGNMCVLRGSNIYMIYIYSLHSAVDCKVGHHVMTAVTEPVYLFPFFC